MSRKRSARTGQSPASFEPLERRALMSAAVDLTIADAGFSDAANQPSPVPGARFYIQPTLLENGQAPTHTLPYAIYLSPTPSLTDQSVRIYSRAGGDFAIWSAPTWTATASGTLPADITPGTWYPIVVVDPDNAISESNESNNTLVADPVTVVLPHDDLIPPPLGLQLPGAPNPGAPAGSPLRLSVDSPYPGHQFPISVAYCLSVDDVAGNADDIPLDTVTLRALNSWDPGGQISHLGIISTLEPYSLPLPADIAPGDYHLVTTVDPGNVIAEPDETNNTTLGPLITILPVGTVDYKAVETPTITNSATAAAGSQIDVGAYAYSVFGQQAHPPMSFILSADDIVGNADDILLGSYSAYVKTPAPPGTIVDYFSAPTLSVTLPSTLAPGHYKIFAVVDPDNDIPEYDEANNVSPGKDITIVPSAPASPAIDLTIADAGFSDAANQPSPVPGADFYIKPTLLENGLAPTDHPLPFSIYLSHTPSLTDQSVRIFQSDGHLPPNTPFAWYTDAHGTLPPSITPGTWYPIVVVDPDNTIPESDESNNVLVASPITVSLPHDDLVPPDTSAPAAWPADSSMNVHSWTYSATYHYPVNVAYALSADDIPGNADDIPLGTVVAGRSATWRPGQPLSGAAMDGFTNGISIPAGVAPGTYHIVTTIDPENTIAEPDETNNSTLGPDITVLPENSLDLIAQWACIGNPYFPIPKPPVAPGSTISVGAYIFSTYGQAAHPDVTFVLSADDTYGNDDDIILGSNDVNAYVPDPPGLVSCFPIPATVDVTLPSDLAPGHYKIFAVVDPDNQISEYDEANNVSPSTDLTIQSPPLISTMPLPDPSIPTVPLITGVTFTPPSPTPSVSSFPSPAQPNQAPSAAAAPTFRKVAARSKQRVAVTLTNPTGRRRTGQFKITFYLSRDNKLSRNDTPFSTQTLTASLRPHQAKTRRLSYKLPPSAKHGRRYVFATATPIHPTRVTTPHRPLAAALRILPKHPSLHSRPISRQILDADRSLL